MADGVHPLPVEEPRIQLLAIGHRRVANGCLFGQGASRQPTRFWLQTRERLGKQLGSTSSIVRRSCRRGDF